MTNTPAKKKPGYRASDSWLYPDGKEKAVHGDLSLPFGIYELHNDEHVAEHIYYHWHEEMEILEILSGEAIMQIDNQQVKAKAGDIFCFLPETLHGAMASPGHGFAFRAFLISPKMLAMPLASSQRYLRPILEGKGPFVPIIEAGTETGDKLHEILKKLNTDYLARPEYYELEVQIDLLSMWKLLCQHFKQVPANSKTPASQSLFKDIVNYLQTNYKEEISVDELANEFNMSSGSLSRYFKKCCGMTIVEYINQYRITQSMELLRNTDKDISEISAEIGFNYVSYYNRVFQKLMHMTPRQYRKNNQA